MTAIGKISEVWRYPVKSFAGERLESCKIEPYGLYGDRCYAFYDEKKEGWASFFTARTIPNMLTYKAKITDEGRGNVTPDVSVTSPDGRILGWSEELLEEIQKHSKTHMSMRAYDTQNDDLLGVDDSSILIITDTTLRKLEALWGKRLDSRRFRANVIVSVDDSALNENDWIGKRLAVGSAEFQVDRHCERCTLITLDPDTIERDPSLLKKVNQELNLIFGVYASVTKTGEIRVGDTVSFVN